ncbi:MAG: glucokinase [Pseudomonadota bacterium]
MMLVADIGGTNARFALAETHAGRVALTNQRTLATEDFETPGEAVAAYLQTVGAKPRHACFAVAAPVDGDDIAFTNNPWRFNRADLQSDMGFEAFAVVNDFAALAAGIAVVPDDFFETIRPGTPAPGAPKLVIGPGTGLGQALLVPCGQSDQVIPTQGGHVSFAPRSPLEIEVMQFIAKEHAHVSVERLVCGNGLVNIYRALCHIKGVQPASFGANDITEAVRTGEHTIAAETVLFFCNVFGAVVGDAALASGTRGGIYLAGGILPKIKDIFLSSDFVENVLSKDPMRAYLEPIPISLIVKDGTALYGAARSLAI